MHVFLALVFIAVCAWAIIRAVAEPEPVALFAATLSLFSIGYYGLPMLLIERSTLRFLPEAEVSAPILMALIFMVSILIGITIVKSRSDGIKGLRFDTIDLELRKAWWVGMMISNAIVVIYNSTRVITFYQVEGVDAYLAQQGVFAGIFGFLVGIAQALSAIYFSIALKEGDRFKISAAAVGIALQLAVVITAGQRLVFVMPLVTVVAALVAQRQYRTAGSALMVAISALLLISPFAVALRSGAWNGQQDVEAANFSYGENPFDTVPRQHQWHRFEVVI